MGKIKIGVLKTCKIKNHMNKIKITLSQINPNNIYKDLIIISSDKKLNNIDVTEDDFSYKIMTSADFRLYCGDKYVLNLKQFKIIFS